MSMTSKIDGIGQWFAFELRNYSGFKCQARV